MDKDLYCNNNNTITINNFNNNLVYKQQNDPKSSYLGIYHLAGIFLTEEGKGPVSGKQMWAFCLIFNKKKRFFLSEDKAEYDSWVKTIRKVIGYSNLNDDYKFLDGDLGTGRYGIVKPGIHIKLNKKVAIKIILKEKLVNSSMLAVIRNEIEVLKISQHPNIIKIYNVYENSNNVYISI